MVNIFIAGGSGAIGRELVPRLVAEGYRVTALTRTKTGGEVLSRMGAEPVQGDVFACEDLRRIVAAAQPSIVIHQLTAFGEPNNGLDATIRVRVEGTRNLIIAALEAGATRLITQSISFICSPVGLECDGLTDETTPLYLNSPPGIRPLASAVADLEEQTLSAADMQSVVLRYGWFYGAGTDYDPAGSIPRAIKKGRMAIVGSGAGVYSFVHLGDAASATMLSLTRGKGIYNIVDDTPVRLSEWLPAAAKMLDAPPPPHMELDAARDKLGDLFVYTMNEQRGASNARAKQQLGWRPAQPIWRDGFKSLYS